MTILPQSSTAMWRSSSTWPVSASTSTTATCEPNGNDEPSDSEVELVLQPLGDAVGPLRRILHRGRELGPRQAGSRARPRPRGHRRRRRRCRRGSLRACARRAAWPARALPRSRRNSALPPICSEREPPVPPPRGTSSVSECSTRTSSIGTPSASAMICANVGLVALAVRARADARGDRAVVFDLDRAELLVEHQRRADLEVRRDADAEQLRVAALAPRGLLGAQRVVAGVLERDVERLRRTRRCRRSRRDRCSACTGTPRAG